MAEAVISSAFESLDCWLHKKGDIREENLEKLYSLIVGMSDLGEENKEMVHTLLLQYQMKELYNLMDLNEEKLHSLVVGMADFWEYYKGKLYHLLFRVALGDDEREVNNEKLRSFLFEIADMWGDDEGEVNKEKLHSLLVEITNLWRVDNNHSKIKMIRRISGEVVGLWKDKQPKLNKEKLYTWIAHKVDLWESLDLLGVLLDAVLVYDASDFHKGVEGANRELGEILDLISDKNLEEESSLHYFISDVVDMAHQVHFLTHLMDSHPFALFFQLTVYLQDRETYYKWFSKKFKPIVRGLQEIKVSMLGFGDERLQNVTEMEGGENVVGLEEDVNLLLSDEFEDKTTVIRGMTGSGKITLARLVYNHTTIAQQFERRAWVCLSKLFSRKEILVSLIRQVVDVNELASLE